MIIHLVLTAVPALAVHRKEIVFKNTPRGELRITHFYVPDWKAADRRSAVVFFFGSGFVGGSTRQFYSKAAYLAGATAGPREWLPAKLLKRGLPPWRKG